jgi:hypothetical protein
MQCFPDRPRVPETEVTESDQVLKIDVSVMAISSNITAVLSVVTIITANQLWCAAFGIASMSKCYLWSYGSLRLLFAIACDLCMCPLGGRYHAVPQYCQPGFCESLAQIHLFLAPIAIPFRSTPPLLHAPFLVAMVTLALAPYISVDHFAVRLNRV